MKNFNETDRIEIVSLSDGIVSIQIPELLLKVEWNRKGVKKKIEFGKLRQALYDNGVEYMFKTGMLYIEDMDAKKALELEPVDASEPENIIILTENQIKRLLTTAPLEEFKKTVQEVGKEQLNEIITYAIKNEITDFNRCEFLKELSDRDIIKAIQLNRMDKEKVSEKVAKNKK